MSIGIYQTNQNTTSALLIDEDKMQIVGEVSDYRYPKDFKNCKEYRPAPDLFNLVFKGIFK